MFWCSSAAASDDIGTGIEHPLNGPDKLLKGNFVNELPAHDRIGLTAVWVSTDAPEATTLTAELAEGSNSLEKGHWRGAVGHDRPWRVGARGGNESIQGIGERLTAQETLSGGIGDDADDIGCTERSGGLCCRNSFSEGVHCFEQKKINGGIYQPTAMFGMFLSKFDF
jgi:hypothetical protein